MHIHEVDNYNEDYKTKPNQSIIGLFNKPMGMLQNISSIR